MYLWKPIGGSASKVLLTASTSTELIKSFHPIDFVLTNRWQGGMTRGAYWINHGLPQYVAIDRKPEAGYEIQNTTCGPSGIMLQLKLAETAELESAHAEVDANTGLLHGTKVLKFLARP